MNAITRLPEAQDLTDRQRKFVAELLRGAKNNDALERAGYSDGTEAATILGSRAVQNALQAGRKAIIRGELGGEAIEALRDLLKPSTPAATRFQAAKFVLEHTQDATGDGDKPLSEMTEAELRGVIERSHAAMTEAKDARIIDVTPQSGAQPG